MQQVVPLVHWDIILQPMVLHPTLHALLAAQAHLTANQHPLQSVIVCHAVKVIILLLPRLRACHAPRDIIILKRVALGML